MQWLLSSYTLRLNRRRALVGHLFSGRYKALLVDGSGTGYLKTVCDYVHLNPARAGLLSADERLLSSPWSSLPWYLAAPAHRPAWIRAERLLGAHGIQQDTPAGRVQFEQRMEARRRAEAQDAEWEPLQNDGCLGSDQFKTAMLAQMEDKLGDNHSGELKHLTAEAERFVLECGGTTPLCSARRVAPPPSILANRRAIAHQVRRCHKRSEERQRTAALVINTLL